jgi:16S rRNA (guanine966-N2)-methyltransferase
MPRIVGGSAGGRTISVPSRGTRPTSDRVREALFSTLDGLVELAGARVLDLFAGSGALGLESVSRGAAAATLVDSARDAAQVIRRNTESLGLNGVQIRQLPVEVFLAGDADRVAFDVVFADPPYAFNDAQLASVLGQLAAPAGWLADGAVVVVERSARSGPPPWPIVIQPLKDKRYGETVLWYGQHDQRDGTP